MKFFASILTACSLLAAGPAPSGFPFADEALTYAVHWPSGLVLGEAKLSAVQLRGNWTFDLKLEASVPGYPVKDSYHSVANLNLCASEFDRDTSHGAKKASEKTSIANGTAVRQTVGGGKSELSVAACAHDALTFLFYARREMGQGKIPPADSLLFGAAYPISLQYIGPQNISVNNVLTEADRVLCTVQARANQTYQFEVFFARDAARTPLMVRAPFALGAISMELVR
jgi:hypothetical protein